MLLVESQILPPSFVFVEAMRQKGFLIEQNENYQKKSLRNRFYLASPTGIELSTIPVKKGKAQKKPISEVRISFEEDWVVKLGQRLKTSYGSAPYFLHYFDQLMELFETKFDFLVDLNAQLLQWIIRTMELQVQVEKTASYQEEHNPLNLDWRNKNLSFYHNYSSNDQMVYEQIFEYRHGFIHNLSIIDMLFNAGPESGLLIRKLSQS